MFHFFVQVCPDKKRILLLNTERKHSFTLAKSLHDSVDRGNVYEKSETNLANRAVHKCDSAADQCQK